MLSVTIEIEPEFKAGQPETLFLGPVYASSTEVQNYDIMPDGQRFVMVKSTNETAPDKLHIVVNWSDVLSRLTSQQEES
jgi:hypothetical protein